MNPVLLLVAALGLVVAVLAARELWRARGDEPWPRALAALLVTVLGVAHHSELLPASSLPQLAVVAGTGVAVLALLAGPPRWRTRPAVGATTAVACVLGACVVMFTVNVAQNYVLGSGPLLGRVIPVAYWLLVLVLCSAGGLSRLLLVRALVLTLGLVAVAVLLAPAPFRACDQFKCGLLGELLRGPFSSENFLAMLAALALVLLVGTRTGPSRVPAALLCLVLLVATGGRTSQLAAGLGVAALLAVRAVVRTLAAARATARLVAVVLPAVCAAIGLWLIATADAGSLSNRGAIWVRAREALDGHEILGLGISRWAGYDDLGPISQHFPHSTYLLLLFSGGAVALVLVLAAVGRAVAAAGPDDLAVSVGYAVVVLVLGLSEIVTNLMTVDGLTWVLLPLVALGPARPAPGSPDAPTAPLSTLVAAGARAGRTGVR